MQQNSFVLFVPLHAILYSSSVRTVTSRVISKNRHDIGAFSCCFFVFPPSSFQQLQANLTSLHVNQEKGAFAILFSETRTSQIISIFSIGFWAKGVYRRQFSFVSLHLLKMEPIKSSLNGE